MEKLNSETGRVLVVATVLAASLGALGCGATCKRIEKDRQEFLERQAAASEPHVELTVPFVVAEELVNPHVKKLDEVDLDVPGLGQLGDHLDRLSLKATGVKLRHADGGRVGFEIKFAVRDRGEKAFTMSVKTEVEPVVDVSGGRIEVGFGAESFKKVRPKLSKDAKKALGKRVYERLPKLARALLPRKLVYEASARVVKYLVERFYQVSREKLLEKIGALSRIELDLPELPVADAAISTYARGGGGLRLLLHTDLPVRAGVRPAEGAPDGLTKRQIGVRLSGSALAELTNWAMAAGHLPNRYNAKGKPKKNGELRPALDWVPGKRPMKVVLWDLEKPCMRLTMGAKPSVEVQGDKVRLKAEDAELEDVEAAAFTEAGVWFYSLWKDAIDVKKSTPARMRFDVAGQKLVTRVRRASLVDDELVLGLVLDAAKD